MTACQMMLKVDYRYGNYLTKVGIKFTAERLGLSWRTYCAVLRFVRDLRDRNPKYRLGQQVALDGLHCECLRFARGVCTQEELISYLLKYWEVNTFLLCEFIDKIAKK